MVSLKWGEVLSTLLPGAVALFAIAPYFPTLKDRIDHVSGAGLEGGIVLIMACALAGGVLEAFNRLTWEPYVLVKRCKSPDALSGLTPENMELYERGVQSSYKYCTFYSNFGLAMVLLLISHLQFSINKWSIGTGIIAGTIGVLFRASFVQWKYFVNYQTKVFCRVARTHVEK